MPGHIKDRNLTIIIWQNSKWMLPKQTQIGTTHYQWYSKVNAELML